MVESIEIAWFLISALGAVFGGVGFYYAVHDLNVLIRDGENGARLILAKMMRRKEAQRFYSQTIFCLMGLLSMFRPPPQNIDKGPPRSFLILLLMSITIVKAYGTLRDLIDRHRITEQDDAK